MSYYDDASLVLIPSGVKAAKVYSQKPTNGTGDLTFSRASTATRTNASGAIVSVASDVPRLDYSGGATCPRLLLEPQRTNSIRNSSMVGAVAGSPGTLPTNWAATTTAGLTVTIVGTGTESGLSYIDFKFAGTSTSTIVRQDFETTIGIAAANGQTWANSFWFKIISAPTPPLSYQLAMLERTSGGALVTSGVQTFTPSTTLNRFSYVRTLSGGGTVAAVQSSVLMNLTNGATYDFTIRIAAPQMELGSFQSTWIPTTTAAVTKLVDIAEKFGVGSLIGSPAGTIFLQVQILSLGYARSFISLQDTSFATNSIRIETTAANRWRIQIRNASTTILDQTILTGSAFTTGNYKLAYAYDTNTNGVAFYVNGVSLFTTTVASIPTACVNLFLGTRLATIYDLNVSDSFDQALLFKTRLTNAQLAQLTTL